MLKNSIKNQNWKFIISIDLMKCENVKMIGKFRWLMTHRRCVSAWMVVELF